MDLQALKHQYDHLSRGQRASMEAAVRSKASQQRVTFNLDSETEHSLKDLDARAHSNAERAHSNAELQAHQSDRSKSPPPVRSQMSLSPEPQGRAISAPALSDGTAWITERIAMEEDGRFKGAKRHQDIAMMHIHKVCWKICARLCATQTSHLPVLTVMQRNDNCCRANRRAPWLPARLRNKETMTASSSMFFIKRSLYFDKILALVIGVVFDHFKYALAELSMAISTVLLLANSTSAICSPIAGLKILPNLAFFSV